MSQTLPTDSPTPIEQGGKETAISGIVGTEINVLGALYDAIAGAQTLKAAVTTIQNAASRIDTTRGDIEQIVHKGENPFSGYVTQGTVALNLEVGKLQEDLKQYTLDAIIRAIRSINFVEKLLDPFLASNRQGE